MPASSQPDEAGKTGTGSAGLERFKTAQRDVYEDALRELVDGKKKSHWMWFIFPQLRGLGHSEMTRFYAIADLAQARAYLADASLGGRLLECTEAMNQWGTLKSAGAILGPVDALKFRSSMTLFDVAGNEPAFARALELFYDAERDPMTLRLLEG